MSNDVKVYLKKRLEGKVKLLVVIVSMWQGYGGYGFFFKYFCNFHAMNRHYLHNVGTDDNNGRKSTCVMLANSWHPAEGRKVERLRGPRVLSLEKPNPNPPIDPLGCCPGSIVQGF